MVESAELATTNVPSNFAILRAANKAYSVHPNTGVAIRAFGIGSASDANTIKITGWMSNDKGGPGYGQELWEGTVTLGSDTSTELPNTGTPEWPAGTYREGGTWDSTGHHNAANAIEIEGGGQGILLLPTLGYANLTVEVTTLNSTNMGLLIRPVTNEGVFQGSWS